MRYTNRCEGCGRATDDLTLCRATDQYLCEPCTLRVAQDYLDSLREAAEDDQ